MLITTAVKKMVDFYEGNIHDIDHFLKVWAFAKTIGEEEKLDQKTQEIHLLKSMYLRNRAVYG